MPKDLDKLSLSNIIQNSTVGNITYIASENKEEIEKLRKENKRLKKIIRKLLD